MTKIATCCYCGTRAALVLGKGGRQELACAACGAPLTKLKMLRKDRVDGGRPAKPRKVKKSRPATRPPIASRFARVAAPNRRRRYRKSLLSEIVEEALDVIEDIFD